MKIINSLKTYEQAIIHNPLTVMIFVSDWCPDCHYMDLYLDELESVFPTIHFYKVDREAVKDLSIHLNIYGVPSLLFYKDEELIDSYIDKTRKSFHEVCTFIDQCLSKKERR